MAELDAEQQLRVTALEEAIKFGAWRAAHGRAVPGASNVVYAAESFLKFLKGESADVTEGDDSAD